MIGDRYIVKSGDCLWKIARETLGSGVQWPRIWRYNNRREVVRVTGRGIPNPDLIHPGQLLLIPKFPNAPRATETIGIAALQKPSQAQAKGAAPTKQPAPMNGPLSAQLPKTESPISIKYNLEDMKFPPIVKPGMTMEIKMTGSVVVMSKKKYPSLYVTKRRELEMQAVQRINQAFSSLLSDVQLVYDEKERKLTYRSMLVTQSRHPNAWATAVGVQMDSSSPFPKLRFEYRAPNPLIGSLPMYTYRGIGVAIVIELTPKPDAPLAQKSTPNLQTIPVPAPAAGWSKVAGVGLVVLGGVIVVGTIVEDFFTVGSGTLDDPASYALASGVWWADWR